MPPKGRTPGLKRGNPREDGTRWPYWVARQVVRDTMGFPDKCIPLPHDADIETLSTLCLKHTTRLFAYLDNLKAGASSIEDEEQRKNSLLIDRYNGTVAGSIQVYRDHTQSPYN